MLHDRIMARYRRSIDKDSVRQSVADNRLFHHSRQPRGKLGRAGFDALLLAKRTLRPSKAVAHTTTSSPAPPQQIHARLSNTTDTLPARSAQLKALFAGVVTRTAL